MAASPSVHGQAQIVTAVDLDRPAHAVLPPASVRPVGLHPDDPLRLHEASAHRWPRGFRRATRGRPARRRSPEPGTRRPSIGAPHVVCVSAASVSVFLQLRHSTERGRRKRPPGTISSVAPHRGQRPRTHASVLPQEDHGHHHAADEEPRDQHEVQDGEEDRGEREQPRGAETEYGAARSQGETPAPDAGDRSHRARAKDRQADRDLEGLAVPSGRT
jgi:hypothetical protein